MARLAEALAAGRELGPPEEEGYLPRGFRRNRLAEKPGAERAIDLLLAKLARRDPERGRRRLRPRPASVRRSRISPRRSLALVTEAGCVPQGNPDRLPTIRAQGWLRYDARRRGDAGLRRVRVRARRLRRHARERGSEPARAARHGQRARERGAHRADPRRLLHDHRERHAGGRLDPLRARDRGRARRRPGSRPSSSREPEGRARAAGQCWRRRSNGRGSRRCS